MTKLFNNQYEIVKCLGIGSMGTVYLCRHNEITGQLVALKVIFPEMVKNAEVHARFRNEIVAAYGVSHPNVVRAYEYSRDNEFVGFTMEYVDGGNLAQELAEKHPLAVSRIITLLTEISTGLLAIHDANIIHRDLKPENILLTKDGTVKISDFGIAQGAPTKLSETGGVLGTIDYVAPEYLEKQQLDSRADIYAVGVIAYELLTGEVPFKEETVIGTLTKRLRDDPLPPIRLNPTCPASLSEFVMTALARDPNKRYQSAKQMIETLNDIAKNDLKH